MKKVISILSIFMLFFAINAIASEPSQPKTIPLKKYTNKGDNPHAPGAYIESIHAYMDGDCVSVTFDEPEGMAEVLVKDELGEVCAYTVGSTETEITLSAPLNVGVFSLEISTSLGNDYIGYFFGE